MKEKKQLLETINGYIKLKFHLRCTSCRYKRNRECNLPFFKVKASPVSKKKLI